MPTEDDIFRSSTQFQLWNLSPTSLAALRQQTNEAAKGLVRAAIQRKWRSSPSLNKTSDPDFLTVVEEKTLVDFFCLQLMKLVSLDGSQNSLKFPINVTATAVQFIKRFFLTNSTMSYHPRQIMMTALFLATKTENHHTPIQAYAEKLSSVPGLGKTTPEDILAPEYILIQGLQFCFDVRHPHRGLKGIYIQLLLLLQTAKGGNSSEDLPHKQGKALQKDLLARYGTPALFEKRIEKAYMAVREILNTKAILSDAYFLYTPSQIVFAALHMADADLADTLLGLAMTQHGAKAAGGRAASTSGRAAARESTRAQISACARTIAQASWDDEAAVALKADATAADRKLHFCRNPEKLDLVELNRSQKRGAGEGDGGVEDELAKRRRKERERASREADDVFGPSIGK